jgi:AAA+ superfamily predicted ATPase
MYSWELRSADTCSTIPTEEENDSKSFQSRFESEVEYQIPKLTERRVIAL